MSVTLTIDDRQVTVPEGTTIWDAACQAGVEIPVLCHDPKLRPVGVCRMCAVEVEGARVMAAACVREAEDGMVVRTATEKVERCRGMLTELLLSEQPKQSPKEMTTGDDKLFELARAYGVKVRLPQGNSRPQDDSSQAIAVDHQACILCDQCIRACNDIQNNDVIGRTGKGYTTRISFDLDNAMGKSTCVTCGECVAACPTGALINKEIEVPLRPREQLKTVPSVCPYCGVGCAIDYHVDEKENKVVFVDGRDNPGSGGRLCVKGRYGYDYTAHPHRLVKPLIRVDSAYPKGALSSAVQSSTGEYEGKRKRKRKPGGIVDYDEVMPAFREATWDEALDFAAQRLREIKEQHGGGALAGFGSAKCTNEEAYLFQKLVRAGFGTNNVDHCTRLCHASSVVALLEMIGSGAVTTTFGDIKNADVALITGTNTTSNHPVAASFFKEAARAGTKLIVVDPIRTGIADHAWRFIQIRSSTDVTFYNAVMHVIIEEGLVDEAYVQKHTYDFDRVKESVKGYTPDVAAGICGVPAEAIREIALAYGRARAAVTYWGMGMSQHVYGTDNCRCIISLCLMTGNMGKHGAGLHPLRGQNNVQGASDAGLIPMVFNDYQSVADDAIRAKYEKHWGLELDPKPGLTMVEIITAALEGSVRGMYMVGENPFLSDPNTNKVRRALANLDFLVVQDIFLTETAEFADVVLPSSSALEKLGTVTNTDRRVQVVRPVLTPPGEAREDWRVICDLSTRIGYPMPYEHPEEVFREMIELGGAYANLTYENLGLSGKLYPCDDPENSDGTVVMFGDGFPTESGKARFVPVQQSGPEELPDEEFPFVLVTGRMLEHWHTGVMTRRSRTLDALEPEAIVEMLTEDMQKLGVGEGDLVQISSRRGSIRLKARATHRMQPGSIFIPFHFREAAANVLTSEKLDPDGKIPEFKFSAVRVELVEADAPSERAASGAVRRR